MKKTSYLTVVILVITILVNGIGISFKGEVFAHELDHARLELSSHPAMHLEMHQNNTFWSGIEIDAATHLCLHSAGQFQPFFFHSFPQLPSHETTETQSIFISVIMPEAIPELPLRPPRRIS